ncbi:MAG: tripartite tricarboxylate transporter substrate binding protein [Burkholderiales bacterium]|nr:tripartite tricarboxylate transporter substrate binding protein [Burkholderiales bacterium]
MIVRIVALALAFALSAGSVFAETFPSRSIRIVVPWPAGGIADVRARQIADRASKILGKPVVVENRPGASGTVGLAAVAQARPDGYTLVLGTVNDLAVAPALRSDLPYVPSRDFAPITQYSRVPPVLVVHGALPIRSLDELARYARSREGGLRFGTYGPATTSHVMAEALAHALGVELIPVHYKGGSLALTAVVAGEVDAIFDFPLTTLPFAEQGLVRAILVADTRRVSILPDVPTVVEAGHPDLALPSWGGFLAPAKTPPAVLKRLNGVLVEVLRSPDLVRDFERSGTTAVGSTAEAFDAFIRQEQGRWRDVIRKSGVRPQ